MPVWSPLRLGALVLFGLLAGCAAGPDWRAELADRDPRDTRCLVQLAAFDAAVTEAGVADAGAARVAGFPYLRVDRLLASFDDELDSPAAFADWVTRMRELDGEARAIEAANLPASQREALSSTPGAAPALNACATRLMERELLAEQGAGPARERLRSAVEAPDHYLTWRRALGLYPLTRLGLALGYNRWKADYLDTFEAPFATLPAEAPLVRYAPPTGELLDAAVAARWLREAPRSPLGFVELDRQALLRLAAHHAPVFLVETQGHDDRFGAPYWFAGPEGPLPLVDTNRPVADVRLSHTRFEGELLPQLVYTLWFPARPRQGALDLLGGRLDGLVWRVTLDERGRALIHDSIHPCGCYHLFFPVPPLERVAVAADADLREAPLTPIEAPRMASGQRLAVRVAAVSHYVEHLGVADPGVDVAEARRYALKAVSSPPDHGRRSLALPGGGRRSLYGPEGLVSHTGRLERFLLWPSGILSPGAMRQWGTHATVFVGRRHFDDPRLFEVAFARPASSFAASSDAAEPHDHPRGEPRYDKRISDHE
ncbi:hypothetical protein RSO68_08560 [Halomonas saccharevitans]|uniref:Uncharacterized protein n=1 Tax=Halomonas saccharevitans TaxID=416872 RepID=A0ABU3NEA1_9GAMM|nr:hypothetical protein [Halomonas saccharevitans]MDT8879519.1 hypothetical protein [Halomonas saccharevitans]